MRLISATTLLATTTVLAMALATAAAVSPATLDAAPSNALRTLLSASVMSAMSDLKCFTKDVVDIDIPGNDVGSASATDPSLCFNHCWLKDNCVAWTWTNHQGGTCWLKSAYSSAAYKPGARTAVRGNCAQLNGSGVYVVLLNYDMPGYDVPGGWFQGRSYSDCVSRAVARRAPVTWSDYNGGTCWLKSARGAYQYAQNKHTVIVL